MCSDAACNHSFHLDVFVMLQCKQTFHSPRFAWAMVAVLMNELIAMPYTELKFYSLFLCGGNVHSSQRTLSGSSDVGRATSMELPRNSSECKHSSLEGCVNKDENTCLIGADRLPYAPTVVDNETLHQNNYRIDSALGSVHDSLFESPCLCRGTIEGVTSRHKGNPAWTLLYQKFFI